METIKQDDGHRVVPRSCVRVAKERTRVSPPGHTVNEPRITLIREGDTVQAIEVECTCGKKIRLNCVF
jgi:hypothetical protein